MHWDATPAKLYDSIARVLRGGVEVQAGGTELADAGRLRGGTLFSKELDLTLLCQSRSDSQAYSDARSRAA